LPYASYEQNSYVSLVENLNTNDVDCIKYSFITQGGPTLAGGVDTTTAISLKCLRSVQLVPVPITRTGEQFLLLLPIAESPWESRSLLDRRTKSGNAVNARRASASCHPQKGWSLSEVDVMHVMPYRRDLR
jgi:hypothetical protein